MHKDNFLGLVASARLGNCFDFARHLLPVEKVVCLCTLSIGPCSGCNYECMRKQACPKNDDLKKLYDKWMPAENVIVFSPVYDGRPPSMLYAFFERVPSLWQREEEGFAAFGGNDVGIVVVGNEGAQNTERAIRSTFESLGSNIVGSCIITPDNYTLGGGIKGGLIQNLEVKRELDKLMALFPKRAAF